MAILIIAIGLVGVLSLVIQNIQAQYINKNILIASGLAQEGLELVRNQRDTNWLTPGNSWNQDIVGDGTYTIDYNWINGAVDSLNDSGAKLPIYLTTGFYSHTTFDILETNFYRLITVDDLGDFLDVECTIRWREGSQDHDYTAETYLYNWR